MNYNLTIYQQISRVCTFSLTYALAFLVFLTIYKGYIPAPLYLLGIPLFIGALALMERYCYHFLMYFFLHILLIIPIIFVPAPTVYYRYLYGALLLIETLRDCYHWIRGGIPPYNDLPWPLFAFALLTYIIATANHLSVLSRASYYIGLTIMILHFVRYYLSGMEELLSQPGNMTSWPTRKIMLTSCSLFFLFIISFTAICLFFRLFDLDFLLTDLRDFLLQIIRFVFHAVSYVIALLRALFARDSKAPEEPLPEAQKFQQSYREVVETPLLMEILTAMIKIAIFAFLLYLLFRLLSHFIKTYMTRYLNDADVIVTLNVKEEHTTTKPPKRSFKERIASYLDFSPVARIRRAYRTRILHYHHLTHQKSETTTELAKQVMTVYDEDIQTLTQIYQKARYSNDTVTDADLSKIALFEEHPQ